MASPKRPVDDWPDLYRPASYVAEALGRSRATIREWARQGKIRTILWEPTGEKLVHLADARDRDRAASRRCGGRNHRASLADVLHRLDAIKSANAH